MPFSVTDKAIEHFPRCALMTVCDCGAAFHEHSMFSHPEYRVRYTNSPKHFCIEPDRNQGLVSPSRAAQRKVVNVRAGS